MAEGFQFVVQTDNERTGASDSGPFTFRCNFKAAQSLYLEARFNNFLSYVFRPQLASKMVIGANNTLRNILENPANLIIMFKKD